MTIDSTTLTATSPGAGPSAQPIFHRTRILRLPRSPKVLVGLVIMAVFGVIAVIGGWIVPYSPNQTDEKNWVQHVLVPGTGPGTDIPANFYPLPLPPSAAHWLGTTVFAQDVWSQLLTSTQATLFVGLLAAAIATVLSVLIGVSAGYLGGSAGEGRLRIILVEVLPNLIPIVAASFLFTSLAAIGAYIVIAFLGLAGSPTSSPPGLWNWGEMLREGFANNAVRGGWWWWWAPPGVLIAVLGTGLALLNFGIDEFINPRLRAAGLTRKAARKAGISVRPKLGMTQVIRERPKATSFSRPSDAVLEIRGLSVDYGYGDEAVHAVVDCNLVLRRGRVLGLAGESGSGKSTLALAAIRLLRAPAVITAGEVLFHSKPISGDGPTGTIDLLAADDDELRAIRWSEIAVVLQSSLNALNPVITIGAQFDDLLRVHRPHLSATERWARSVELFDMVGINAERLRSYSHELSGGMRQRAMIAMAIALEPQVMILDEPTTALDVVTQREIIEELVGLRDRIGFATLFITHDLSLLVELADEIDVMYAGRLMERAPAASLFRAPRLPYTHGLLHCFPPLHGPRVAMEGIPGSPPDLRDLPSGCPFNPRCKWAMPKCRQELPRMAPLNGDGREVACWLHRDGATVPAELALPEPAILQGPISPPGPSARPP